MLIISCHAYCKSMICCPGTLQMCDIFLTNVCIFIDDKDPLIKEEYIQIWGFQKYQNKSGSPVHTFYNKL